MDNSTKQQTGIRDGSVESGEQRSSSWSRSVGLETDDYNVQRMECACTRRGRWSIDRSIDRSMRTNRSLCVDPVFGVDDPLRKFATSPRKKIGQDEKSKPSPTQKGNFYHPADNFFSTSTSVVSQLPRATALYRESTSERRVLYPGYVSPN